MMMTNEAHHAVNKQGLLHSNSPCLLYIVLYFYYGKIPNSS